MARLRTPAKKRQLANRLQQSARTAKRRTFLGTCAPPSRVDNPALADIEQLAVKAALIELGSDDSAVALDPAKIAVNDFDRRRLRLRTPAA